MNTLNSLEQKLSFIKSKHESELRDIELINLEQVYLIDAFFIELASQLIQEASASPDLNTYITNKIKKLQKELIAEYQYKTTGCLLDLLKTECKNKAKARLLEHLEQAQESRATEVKTKKQNKVTLSSELKKYQGISQPVFDLIYSVGWTIRVTKKAKDVIEFTLTDIKTDSKALLYLSQGFEWIIQPLKKDTELPECFPEDFYDFCACNDVYLDELYESLD